MAAEYDFRKKPSKGKGDGPDELIPRIVSKGTIRTGDLIKDLSQPTTFQEGELMGALETLVNGVVTYLENGYTVELGNLGFFSLKLKARPVTDKKEIRSPSIVVDKVNFRSSAWLRKQLATVKLQRARSGFRSSAAVEKSER
ncbi:MAG: hypothetical protein LUD02_12925 [Tannerellaceae bacterium]|nr:hypothetical protein [Tannerellaceae bacterium]MCD8264935.1 hypothetical protein [Tannerellaceae bacterium]